MKRKSARFTRAGIMMLATAFAGAGLAAETKSARVSPGGNMPCHANGKVYATGRMMSGTLDNVRPQPSLEQLGQIRDLAALQAALWVRRAEMVQLWLADKPDRRQLVEKLRQISDLDLQMQEKDLNYQLASGLRVALPAGRTVDSPAQHMGMYHGAGLRQPPLRMSVAAACH